MTNRFTIPEEAVEKAVSMMKSRHIIHKEAIFNKESNLRKEVTLHDRDFQDRLGWREPAEATIQAALDFLKDNDVISRDATYSFDNCDKFFDEVGSNFEGSWTSLTHSMKFLIYMLTSIRKPKDLLELGSFWGFTLAWFAGPCIGNIQEYEAKRIIGIDIDEKACISAKENFLKLRNTEKVEIIHADALKAIDDLEGKFDFLYLEAKADEIPDLYLKLLKKVYDKLPDGAWVIAHDTTAYRFEEENQEYLAWVRDKKNFSKSLCFDIDNYGLELSIK